MSAADALPTGTVSLLFTDVEGSTEIARAAGEGFAGLMDAHREIVGSAIAEAGGREIEATGDECFAVFERAASSAAAAVAIQRRLGDHPWPEATPVRVRVGIHTGDPIFAGSSYLGLHVHRAARICAAGHGGQILLSQTTESLLRDAELGGTIEELGEFELKGLPRPERIFQLTAPGLRSEFPPLRLGDDARRGSVEPAEASPRPLRIVLAEDSVLLREGIALVLENAGCEVVGQAGDPDDLLLKTRSYEPDVAIVDVRMPPTHTDEGLRAAQEIRRLHPDVGVLVLSQYVEPAYVIELLAEDAAGVGYLLKDRVNDVKEFVASVRRVAERGTAFDPEVVSRLVGRRQRDGVLDDLSPREREVLSLMAEGRSNQAISQSLYMSARAVERHVTGIFEKLRLPATSDDNRRVLAVLAFLKD